MAYHVILKAPGGPEALEIEPHSASQPSRGEVLIRHTAIGLNFIDTYHRSGLYPLLAYPAVLGMEASGIVEAVGPDCRYVREGDRVAYGSGPPGAYGTHRVIAERYLVKLPAGIDDQTAAAVMVKGLTAHYLLCQTYPVKAWDWILVHAAAGGVGSLLCQWAKHLGVSVIGSIGSEEKAKIAIANGCAETIDYRREDIAGRVRHFTGGEGVGVVYDSVGQSTFMASLDSLRNFGLLVSYGQSSGSIPPFDLGLLARKGSLYITRPSLVHYIEDTESYRRYAEEMFALIGQGVLKVAIGQRYALKDIVQAHRDLEARRTTGSTILVP